MKDTDLTRVANQAAIDAGQAIGASMSRAEADRVTAIIAKAMETAVLEASSQHSDACADCVDHDADLAHKIRAEIERKKIGLIANLSSLR
ncbi:MAG: hypothetical protein OXU71_08430 [Gammaproteobacteria bacterium]|nr:hypothetical protein [Gammaproteobacteria bacterium]